MPFFAALALAFLVACGSPREEATSAPPVEPISEPPVDPLVEPPVEPPVEPVIEPAPADPEIGWTELPEPPSEEAYAANREALRVHESGDYAASEALFGEVARAHPGYLIARFNQACAMTRLGRINEAARALAPLLAADLPTFGPRVEGDPDLAALRTSAAGERLEALRARLHTRYLDALARGVPMIAYGSPFSEARTWTLQGGVWLHAERRFVPMAPRVESPRASAEDDRAIATAVVDRELARVVTVTAREPFSEGATWLDDLVVTAYAAGSGTELARARWRSALDGCIEAVHATEGGAAVRFGEHASLAEVVVEVGGEVVHRATEGTTLVGSGTFDPEHLPRLRVCSGAVGTFVEPRTDVAVHGRQAGLRVGERTVRVALGSEHPRASRELRVALAPATGPRVWVRTEGIARQPGEGWGHQIALSWIDFEQGIVVPLAQGHGTAAMLVGPDGALYAEIDGPPLRYAEGSAVGEPLIPGLCIVPSPVSFALMNWAVE